MARLTLIVVLTVAIVVVMGCEPKDRRPGLWLSGTVVDTPVADWSFTDDHDEIFVETRSAYLLPHSVTTTVVTSDGTLYVPSLYYEGGTFPAERLWNKNIARDPNVRLKIGGKVYERRATLVTDADERTRVLAAFAAKYDRWRELLKDGDPERPKIILLRMDSRSPS
jgi:F420H(2)-dependent quinone reductase